MTETFECKGVNGQLKVLPGKVIISRKGAMGFLTQGLKGDKEIRIKDISSIQFKKAGLAVNGFIQFTFFGGAEHKGGILDSTKDENTIMFTKAQMANFEKAKNLIEEYRSSYEAAATTPTVVAISPLADLEKLAELKEKGIITHEEFEAKKKDILAKM